MKRGDIMQLNFSGRQDVYLEIVQRYEEYIKLGVFKTGERLPSVRDAAGELGVNPNTVARAYSVLEEQGYIKALPKKGVFVTYCGEEEKDEHSKKEVVLALKNMGVSKENLLSWIEEVYSK